MTDPAARRRTMAAALVSALVSLGLGYLVLEVILAGMHVTWETVPARWGGAPAWYLLAVLLAAGAIVYLIRHFLGDSGHSPLAGITIAPLTPRQYLDVILAIAVSLIGGIVLGPEVALVSTGAVIGGLVAGWMRAPEPKRVVAAGAGGAILALFIGPLLAGSLSLDDRPTNVDIEGVAWAIPIALAVTLLIIASRWLATRLASAAGPEPNAVALVGAALLVAVCAIAFQAWTGDSHTFIVTSGEEYIAELTSVTSTTTLLAIVALKSIAYAASLGAGFRGGPFFPAMFIGAAGGMLLSMLLPAGPPSGAAIAVGVTAAVIATAAMPWVVAIVLAVVIAFALGGWALIPAALLGGIASRSVQPLLGRSRSREATPGP